LRSTACAAEAFLEIRRERAGRRQALLADRERADPRGGHRAGGLPAASDGVREASLARLVPQRRAREADPRGCRNVESRDGGGAQRERAELRVREVALAAGIAEVARARAPTEEVRRELVDPSAMRRRVERAQDEEHAGGVVGPIEAFAGEVGEEPLELRIPGVDSSLQERVGRERAQTGSIERREPRLGQSDGAGRAVGAHREEVRHAAVDRGVDGVLRRSGGLRRGRAQR